MGKIWDKSKKETLHPAVEKYTVGTDTVFDMEFLPFEIAADRAHAKTLQKAGILTAEELQKISGGLDALEKDFAGGKIGIKTSDEDCYTVIENYLTEKLGDIGKKIHTGRSRNEVVTMVRLYMKQNLSWLKNKTLALANSYAEYAEKYKDVPMPGYSHAQQAMLSSVGHYFSAFAESLLDDAEYISSTAKYLDKSPLGSAAGFGVSIPLDREFAAKELGLSKIQVNSLYCQNSRGKFESAYMECLAQIMLTLGRFANDMLLFTSKEFDFFSADNSIVTGSSIMPQKRNLDVLEIMRGNASVVIANQLLIKDLTKNLISGYNRDGQLIKKPLVESTKIVFDSVEVTGIVLSGLAPKPDSMKEKITSGIFTADIANDLVLKKGIPFRDAYKEAALQTAKEIPDLSKNLASKVSLGAPGNLRLQKLKEKIRKSGF